jgi:antitoxin component of MazEF toxin-antitoxin module
MFNPKISTISKEFNENDLINLSKVENKKRKIKKRRNNKLKLEDLINKITSENTHKEVDWGKSVGKEIW